MLAKKLISGILPVFTLGALGFVGSAQAADIGALSTTEPNTISYNPVVADLEFLGFSTFTGPGGPGPAAFFDINFTEPLGSNLPVATASGAFSPFDATFSTLGTNIVSPIVLPGGAVPDVGTIPDGIDLPTSDFIILDDPQDMAFQDSFRLDAIQFPADLIVDQIVDPGGPATGANIRLTFQGVWQQDNVDLYNGTGTISVAIAGDNASNVGDMDSVFDNLTELNDFLVSTEDNPFRATISFDMDATGLTDIPEPSTVFGLSFLAVLGLFRTNKRRNGSSKPTAPNY